MENKEMENKLDGNAAAGILQAIFPLEMTQVDATCATCGSTTPIGAAAAYMSQMGTVLRCPTCYNPLIRVANVKGRNLMDMRGVRVFQIRSR